MRLLHYSGQTLVEVRDTPQLEAGDIHLNATVSMYWKPRGLWVSVEGPDDWRQWCEGENFGIDGLAQVFLIELAADAKILTIGTKAELMAFDRQFTTPAHPEAPAGWTGIDWLRIAELYDGIIIAPYQWELRIDLMWYYTWDCASGCIWNARAIERFTAVGSAAPA